MYIEAAVH